MLSGPAQSNIEEPPFTVTADNQEIRLEVGGSQDNVFTRGALLHDGYYVKAFLFERCNVLVHLPFHELSGPQYHIFAMTSGEFGGKTRGAGVFAGIDTEDMETLRGSSGDDGRHISGSERMGAVLLPLLQGDGHKNGVIHDGSSSFFTMGLPDDDIVMTYDAIPTCDGAAQHEMPPSVEPLASLGMSQPCIRLGTARDRG